MNRIKEVLEQKGIKQTWLAETREKLQYGKRLCSEQATTQIGNLNGDSGYFRHRRERIASF